MGVGGDGLAEASLATGDGKLLDERGGGDEERVEAVLDGSVGDGDGEMRLPTTGLAVEDHRASRGDEVGREAGADERHPDRGLGGEVEVVDASRRGAGVSNRPLEMVRQRSPIGMVSSIG